MAKTSEGSSGSGVQDSMRSAAQDIKREGGRLATSAVKHAESVAEQRKDRTAEYIQSVSAAIHSGGRTLGKDGYETSAGMVERVADQIGGLADNLADRQPRELLREVERFAKERPALFVGAAMLTGFGIARFLKSTSRVEHQGGVAGQGNSGDDPVRRSQAEAVR